MTDGSDEHELADPCSMVGIRIGRGRKSHVSRERARLLRATANQLLGGCFTRSLLCSLGLLLVSNRPLSFTEVKNLGDKLKLVIRSDEHLSLEEMFVERGQPVLRSGRRLSARRPRSNARRPTPA